MQTNFDKPNVLFFLDIDGVFNQSGPYTTQERTDLNNFYKINEHNMCRIDRCVTCLKGEASILQEEPVFEFESLITETEEIAKVGIILASNWRWNRTVDELKDIFQRYPFSSLLIDKTNDDGALFSEWKNHCAIIHDKECRASQINRWLKEHPGYSAFIIIDDNDDHLRANFGDKFISTCTNNKRLFTKDHAKQAFKVIQDQLKVYT